MKVSLISTLISAAFASGLITAAISPFVAPSQEKINPAPIVDTRPVLPDPVIEDQKDEEPSFFVPTVTLPASAKIEATAQEPSTSAPKVKAIKAPKKTSCSLKIFGQDYKGDCKVSRKSKSKVTTVKLGDSTYKIVRSKNKSKIATFKHVTKKGTTFLDVVKADKSCWKGNGVKFCASYAALQ